MKEIIAKYFSKLINSKDDVHYSGNFGNTQYYKIYSKFKFQIIIGYEVIGGFMLLQIRTSRNFPYSIYESKEFQKRQNWFLRRKYGFFKGTFSAHLEEGYIEFFSKYVEENLNKIIPE